MECFLEKSLFEKILKEFNLDLCGMSGSGSACFALSKEKANLKKAYKYFSKLPGYTTFLTEFVL